jgi:hypothetical protein
MPTRIPTGRGTLPRLFDSLTLTFRPPTPAKSGVGIILKQYFGKPEVKSLAPDGTPCTGTTQGLLLRAKIVASKLAPVSKETDRRWAQAQGEEPSMLDFGIQFYEKQNIC